MCILIVQGLGFTLGEAGMKILKGRSVLFIVKKARQNTEANGELMEVVQRAQDLIQVVHLTDDEAAIQRYHLFGDNYTPLKVCYAISLFMYL